LSEIDEAKAAGVVYTFEILKTITSELSSTDYLNFEGALGLTDSSTLSESLTYDIDFLLSDTSIISEELSYDSSLSLTDSLGNSESFSFEVIFSIEEVEALEDISFSGSFSLTDFSTILEETNISSNLSFSDSIISTSETVEFNAFKALLSDIDVSSLSEDLGLRVHTVEVDDILIWDGGLWTGYWDEGHKWSDNP
jgi:hypothetical protein